MQEPHGKNFTVPPVSYHANKKSPSNVEVWLDKNDFTIKEPDPYYDNLYYTSELKNSIQNLRNEFFQQTNTNSSSESTQSQSIQKFNIINTNQNNNNNSIINNIYTYNQTRDSNEQNNNNNDAVLLENIVKDRIKVYNNNKNLQYKNWTKKQEQNNNNNNNNSYNLERNLVQNLKNYFENNNEIIYQQ